MVHLSNDSSFQHIAPKFHRIHEIEYRQTTSAMVFELAFHFAQANERILNSYTRSLVILEARLCLSKPIITQIQTTTSNVCLPWNWKTRWASLCECRWIFDIKSFCCCGLFCYRCNTFSWYFSLKFWNYERRKKRGIGMCERRSKRMRKHTAFCSVSRYERCERWSVWIDRCSSRCMAIWLDQFVYAQAISDVIKTSPRFTYTHILHAPLTYTHTDTRAEFRVDLVIGLDSVFFLFRLFYRTSYSRAQQNQIRILCGTNERIVRETTYVHIENSYEKQHLMRYGYGSWW